MKMLLKAGYCFQLENKHQHHIGPEKTSSQNPGWTLEPMMLHVFSDLYLLTWGKYVEIFRV